MELWNNLLMLLDIIYTKEFGHPRLVKYCTCAIKKAIKFIRQLSFFLRKRAMNSEGRSHSYRDGKEKIREETDWKCQPYKCWNVISVYLFSHPSRCPRKLLFYVCCGMKLKQNGQRNSQTSFLFLLLDIIYIQNNLETLISEVLHMSKEKK